MHNTNDTVNISVLKMKWKTCSRNAVFGGNIYDKREETFVNVEFHDESLELNIKEHVKYKPDIRARRLISVRQNDNNNNKNNSHNSKKPMPMNVWIIKLMKNRMILRPNFRRTKNMIVYQYTSMSAAINDDQFKKRKTILFCLYFLFP